MSIAQLSQERSISLECPFFQKRGARCQARCAAVPTYSPRRQLCESDDHDRCPTYLAFILCQSRPLRVDCDWLDADGGRRLK